MEDRAGCAPGRLPAPSQEIWLWNTGQAVTPAPPPAPPRPGDVIVERGRAVAPPASPGDGIVEHGANFRPGRLDSPGPRIVEHRSGCPPPTNCILIQEMGLWNTGQAVAPGPTCWAPPTPGDGVVEHRPGPPPPRQTVPSCGRLGCGVRGGLCPLPRELEVGLWGTGRAVPRRAARPLSGDMIVEHGVSCDSRPDMLESRLPQEI
jgi:hypothetical protein